MSGIMNMALTASRPQTNLAQPSRPQARGGKQKASARKRAGKPTRQTAGRGQAVPNAQYFEEIPFSEDPDETMDGLDPGMEESVVAASGTLLLPILKLLTCPPTRFA
jgi:hypothetical protein